MSIKNIRFWVLIFLSVFFANGYGQNMVWNWSFESYNKCPNISPLITSSNNWLNPNTADADYYNACAPVASGPNVPNTGLGYQNAKDSNAYAGIFCFQPPYTNARDYITGVLTTPLNSGVKYYVSFFANQPEFMGYSIKTLGAYLTSSAPYVSNYYYWPITPQIENKGGIISDTMNWVMVADTFTAVGGEQYITIGNFQPDSLSDTVKTYPGNYAAAYYFIDAVTVIPYDQVGIGELKDINKDLLVYPNPTQNETEIVFDADRTKRIIVTDVSGKTIYEYSLSNNLKGRIKHKIDLSSFSKGLYFVSVVGENGITSKKLVKE